MSRKIISWVAVTSFTLSAGYFWEKGNLEVAVGMIGILVTIVIALLQTGGPEKNKRASWLRSFLSGRSFEKQYLQLVGYQTRDFDIKGLSTQTDHTLALERVFVELNLQTQVAHRTTSDPLQKIPRKFRAESYPIWKYLSLVGADEKLNNPKVVIVGPPGCGKTTLLRHMALLLTMKSQKAPQFKEWNFKKIPILLFLRDHVREVQEDPSILLSEIIDGVVARLDVEPVPHWFSNQLKNGRCLILLDGLDEVADPKARINMVRWLERQIHIYPNNAFIITSRPHGYKENTITGVSVLEVMPFNREQIDNFVRKWYLANEITSHMSDDAGVRLVAKSGSDDLLQRLEKTPTLMELAVNPLLLTMIATVHRFRSALPGRRVELYKEICEVFLGKRQESKGIPLDMVPAQKQFVLQSLAYDMMCGNIREIREVDVLQAIRAPLLMVAPGLSPEVFLKSIEQQSGLLLERELGIYSFAHKTFQEYLAAMYILDKNLESDLYNKVNDDWWHEVIKLYSARSDATQIITTCLDQEPPTAAALSLAIQCLEEAHQVQPRLRELTEKILLQNAEDSNYEMRKIIAHALLSNRIKHLNALSPSIFIDSKPLTNAEYQIFVDEMLWRGRGDYYPIHWGEKTFAPGTAHLPAYGLLPEDTLAFCDWLTEVYSGSGEWYFRLPLKTEIELTSLHGVKGAWAVRQLADGVRELRRVVEFYRSSGNLEPVALESLLHKAAQEDIKDVISTLRAEGMIITAIKDHDYIKFVDVLRRLLRSSTSSDKLLTDTADRLYKQISHRSISRPVDFRLKSPDQEAYDQSVSDIIQRMGNKEFEHCVMISTQYYQDLLSLNPRYVSRYRPLVTAFAFELLSIWIEKNKPLLVNLKTDWFHEKANYLINHYLNHLIVIARRNKKAEPFEGLIFVREVKEGKRYSQVNSGQ